MRMERGEVEKLTVTKLREMAIEKYPEIKGVHAMKKEELLEAIIAEEIRLGLRPKEERPRRVEAPSVGEYKKRIRLLKAERDRAIATKDRQALRDIRSQIKKLRRGLRKLQPAS